MDQETLHPIAELLREDYPENTAGILDALNSVIETAGGERKSYEHNTGGLLKALIDLRFAIATAGIKGGCDYIQLKLPGTYDPAAPPILPGMVVTVGSDGLVKAATSNQTRQLAHVVGVANALDYSDPEQPVVNVVTRGFLDVYQKLKPGEQYFLAEDGYISAKAASGSGAFVVPVGQAVNETTLDVQPGTPLELS